MSQDAVLCVKNGVYTFLLDDDGQIVVADFLDTAILYSLYGEARADISEVPIPERQKGWIGNEFYPFENGSKLWLALDQQRVTRTVLNSIQDEARKALLWLVEDGLARSIDQPSAVYSNNVVMLNITIRRPSGEVVNRSYELWNQTGLTGRCA